jgi:hypothetical protein
VLVVVPVPVPVVPVPVVPAPVPVLVPIDVPAELDDGLGVEFGFTEPDPELDPQAASTTIALTGTKDLKIISQAPCCVTAPHDQLCAAKGRALSVCCQSIDSAHFKNCVF